MLPNSNNEIKVGIADFKAAKAPSRIITLGLGSCVGITLYDPATKIGGLVHVMLPDSSQFKNRTNLAKYADTGISLLLDELLKMGARRFSIQAKLAGGAQMFNFSPKAGSTLNIGMRNVEMSKKILKKLGIKILGEDTGGNYGRTMILDTTTGDVTIRSVGSPLRIL